MSSIEMMIYETLGAAFFAWMAISHQTDTSPRLMMWFAAGVAGVSWLIVGISFVVQLVKK